MTARRPLPARARASAPRAALPAAIRSRLPTSPLVRTGPAPRRPTGAVHALVRPAGAQAKGAQARLIRELLPVKRGPLAPAGRPFVRSDAMPDLPMPSAPAMPPLLPAPGPGWANDPPLYDPGVRSADAMEARDGLRGFGDAEADANRAIRLLVHRTMPRHTRRIAFDKIRTLDDARQYARRFFHFAVTKAGEVNKNQPTRASGERYRTLEEIRTLLGLWAAAGSAYNDANRATRLDVAMLALSLGDTSAAAALSLMRRTSGLGERAVALPGQLGPAGAADIYPTGAALPGRLGPAGTAVLRPPAPPEGTRPPARPSRPGAARPPSAPVRPARPGAPAPPAAAASAGPLGLRRSDAGAMAFVALLVTALVSG